MFIIYRLSFLFVSLAMLWQPVVQALSPFKAQYNIAFGFVNLGEAEMNFKQVSANKYELGFYAETSGFTALIYPYSLQENSQLERLSNGLLRSTGYFYEEKKEDEIKKQYQVKIDYGKKEIQSVGLNKKHNRLLTASLPTDKLSFAFIIGDDLEQGKKLRSPITVIDGKKNRLIKVEELNEPPNYYQKSLGNSPFQRDDYKQYRRFLLEDDGESMEIWLAKKQRHIPYKMLFTSEGWTLYYELSNVRWLK